MLPLRGPATLTFDDNTTFQVEADISFQQRGGTMSGRGTIRHDDILHLAMKAGSPVLTCGGQRFRVIISQANGGGVGTVTTNGGPLSRDDDSSHP